MWEVRASPPRTNCPVTLVLPEEPRAVSPLAKKRSPKRRIDFKDEEQTGPSLIENASDDGATSWADMVRNGYQRSTSSVHNIAKSKENDENTINKQKRHSTSDSSFVKASRSTNSSKENNSRKFNKEADQIGIEVHGLDTTKKSSTSHTITEVNKSSPCSDRKASGSEFSEAVVDSTIMKEDEGWEVVSRSRGRPSKKQFYKHQSSLSSSTHTFSVSGDASEEEKESLKQSHGNRDVTYDHDNIDDLDFHVDIDSHHDSDPNYHVDDCDSNIDPDHYSGDIDIDYHIDCHDSDLDPDHHADHGDIDSDQYSQHHEDNTNSDDTKWQHHNKTVMIENELAGEDNDENSLQGADGSSMSNVVMDTAVSPYAQVGYNECHYAIVVTEICLIIWCQMPMCKQELITQELIGRIGL